MVNKLFYSALWMTAASLTFCGCDNDNEPEEQMPTDIPLVLTGQIYSFDPAKASEEWKKGKDIGIFFMKENGEAAINSYENVLYKSIEVPAAHFAPPAGSEPIYFPKDGSKANLIAYYPYSSELTEQRVSMDISNQKSASPFNFLYSDNCKGINKDNNKVEMELHPVLSQVVVDLVAGEGVTDEYLKEATAILKRIHSKAQYNLLTGQFENYDAKKDITMLPSETVNSDTAQVIATTSLEGYQLYVSLPKMGREYTWDLSQEITELKQGYRHICQVTIALESTHIETSEEAIRDWTSGSETSGNLQENWIERTIDDLPVGEISPETSKDKPWQHEPGEWLFVAKGVSQIGNTGVEYDSSLGHNVIHSNTYDNGSTWYKTYIAYRMQTLNKETFTLKFKVKGTKGKSVRCFIYREDKKFIAINTGDGKYEGAHIFTLTEEEKEYQIEFDCSKIVTSVYTTFTDYGEATDEILENLFLQFAPTGTDTEFYLYDITLELKKN